jgi:hypothetical protein
MSLSQATLVQRIRLLLGDNPWETLGEASSDTSDIEVQDGEEWEKGDIGEFVEDGDTFFVQDKVSNTLSVVRSYYGSTGASHATSSRILKGPKYRYSEITNAISSVIGFELPWPRIYKVDDATIDPDTVSHPVTADSWYALPAEAMELVSVIQVSDQSPGRKLQYGLFHSQYPVNFQRNLPLALVNTGVGVSFPAFIDSDNDIYVTYAAQITDTVTTGSYDDFDAGDAVVEAIALGAVALLQSALELRKPRKGAQETDNLRSGSYFGTLYKKALWTAEKQIRNEHPLMTNTRSLS